MISKIIYLKAGGGWDFTYDRRWSKKR